jgi:hypothetical protein
MVTREDVESFLLRMTDEVEEVEPGMWIVSSNGSRLVIHHSPPVVILRMKVLEVPAVESDCTALFRKLLELNATDLVHGAYAVEEGDVILTDTLALESLDFDQLQASVDSMQMALASHLESLAPYREC